MKISTCSGAISFLKELEKESTNFYQHLLEKYQRDTDAFLTIIKENGKNIVQIERAYYGVITDAIEGCFAFDLDQEEYQFKTAIEPGVSYYDALREALKMEEKIVKCYLSAADQSQYLMADIPRAFKMIAKKRSDRIQKLRLLLDLAK